VWTFLNLPRVFYRTILINFMADRDAGTVEKYRESKGLSSRPTNDEFLSCRGTSLFLRKCTVCLVIDFPFTGQKTIQKSHKADKKSQSSSVRSKSSSIA